MKLSKLIRQYEWTDVATEFVKQYPRIENRLDTYKELFGRWQRLTPACTDIFIYICPVRKDISTAGETLNGQYYKAYPAIYGYLDKSPNEHRYRLSKFKMGFVRWEEWLGMDICRQTALEFSPTEIICHCIRTMTCHGYSQETIQDIKAMIMDEAEYYLIYNMLKKYSVNTGYLSVPPDLSGFASPAVRAGFCHTALFRIKEFFGVIKMKYFIRKYAWRNYIIDADIRDLHTYLVPFIVRCLTDFLNSYRHGMPAVIPHYIPNEFGGEVWEDMLKEMIFAFEFLQHKNSRRFVKKYFSTNRYNAELKAKALQHVQRGLTLFGIYYLDLWD
jgi:hypothetical protein